MTTRLFATVFSPGLLALCVVACGDDGPTKVTIGSQYSGTITDKSDYYYDEDNAYECYINRYTVNVDAAKTYTVNLSSDNGCVLETPDDSGVFTKGDITDYGSISTGSEGSITATWVPASSREIRLNIYATTTPTQYTFEISE